MVLHELRRGNLGNELGVTSTSGSQLSNSNGYNSNFRGGILLTDNKRVRSQEMEGRSQSRKKRMKAGRVPSGLGGTRVRVGVEDAIAHNAFLQISQMSLLEVGCVVLLPVSTPHPPYQITPDHTTSSHGQQRSKEIKREIRRKKRGIGHEDGLLEDGEGLGEVLGQFLGGEVLDSTRVGVHVQLHLQDSFGG